MECFDCPEQVSRGLLCRAKYGGGLVPPSRYASHEGLLRIPKTPGQRGSGEARRAYKEITKTIVTWIQRDYRNHRKHAQSHICLGRRGCLLGDSRDATQRKPKGSRDADPLPYFQGNHIVRHMERQDHVRSRQVCADCC